MGNLIAFEFKKFLSKKKNILTIFISAIFILIYIIANNSLNNIVEKSKINNYKAELQSAQDAFNRLNRDNDSGKIPQRELDLINELKGKIALLENMLNARSNNDWKGELSAQISLDKQLLADIKSGNAVSGENVNDIENRISINEILLEKNIKPMIVENSMTAYNFVRLAMQQMFPVLSIIITLLLSADFVSAESDEGTFKFLLIQPISRSKILFSKIIASALICILTMAMIMFGFFSALGLILGFGSPVYPTQFYTGSFSFLFHSGFGIKLIGMKEIILMGLPLNILFVIFIASFGILMSTVFQNSATSISVSIMLASAANIFDSQLKLFKSISSLLPFTYGDAIDVLNGNMIGQFGNKNITFLTGIVVLVIFTIAFYSISCFIFKRKDIRC